MYCTLDYAKMWEKTYKATTATLTTDDQRMIEAIRIISRRIDNLFKSVRPVFEPWIESRIFPVVQSKITSSLGTFSVDDYLLALTTPATVNGTEITLAPYPGTTVTPYNQLRLTSCCQTWYSFCTSDPLILSVPGIWGFNRDYTNAFVSVDALAGNINDAVELITVADVDGPGPWGVTPRISIGNLIQVDTEWMRVFGMSPTAQTASVKRGVHGSTPAAHTSGAAVKVYQVEEPIQRAVAQMSGFVATRLGEYATAEIRDFGIIKFPDDWLNTVLNTVEEYSW